MLLHQAIPLGFPFREQNLECPMLSYKSLCQGTLSRLLRIYTDRIILLNRPCKAVALMPVLGRSSEHGSTGAIAVSLWSLINVKIITLHLCKLYYIIFGVSL